MSQYKPISLKDFDATKLSLGKITKDSYGGKKMFFLYNKQYNPITVRIEDPLYTYGISHIKDFINKDQNTGKFQITCLPYKIGGTSPDFNTSSEILFYNNFEKALLDATLKLVLENKDKFGLDSTIYGNDLIKSLIKNSVWKGKETTSKSCLFLKVQSKYLSNPKTVTFSDILTPFYKKNKDKIPPQELEGKRGNVYLDITIHGLYQKQKGSKITTQLSVKGGVFEEVEEKEYARDF